MKLVKIRDSKGFVAWTGLWDLKGDDIRVEFIVPLRVDLKCIELEELEEEAQDEAAQRKD